MVLDKVRKKFDLSVVKNIELEDMAIDFTGPDHWLSTLSSDHMIARLTSIPGFSWPIQQVQLRVIIRDNNVDIGKLESPFAPASVKGGIVTSSLTQSTMSIFPTAHSNFCEFIKALATKPSHTFAIKGSADIVFDLGRIFGVHTLKGVDFISDLTLRGLNNIPDISCTSIQDVHYRNPLSQDSSAQQNESEEDRSMSNAGYDLLVEAQFDIVNPSQLSLTLGKIRLAVSTAEGGHPLGIVTMENFTLLQGMNDARQGTIVFDTSLDSTLHFLKEISVRDQTVALNGFHGTSANEALTEGLMALSTTCVIPRFHSPHKPEPSHVERQ
ncbi:hypothetical protein EMPS_07256 [Entomortierella parvispora]|uniref:Uncharacterized protein n=1 Tax=Entomortierella parvispora TaxID=205924 RepID=A0A9P3HEK3_9FUNG|nr:hypothetical protein EMPS_07256 [Entomortierella parvispora]